MRKLLAYGLLTAASLLFLYACNGPGKETTAPPVPSPSERLQNALFIGDSLTVGLKHYQKETQALGNPDFLCLEGFSQTIALDCPSGDPALPEYPEGSGRHPRVEEGAAQSGARNIYFLLGVNCIGQGVDRAAEDLVTLVKLVSQRVPEASIFIQSVTPLAADSPRADEALNNQTIRAYNRIVQAQCQENGWYYLDIAQALADPDGDLRPEFTHDQAMGLHLNYDGTAAWADFLLTQSPEVIAFFGG